ncbi:hypothetical protein AVEN_123641-1 [Araneus ventricosus]|uniref:Uncharacterized protein n=1 Tax=Araneus ventricosus TaxID=182803 RepID=A0A4Y2U987_ARAVE|nr:hypothetical protein AVEN_123641-1 [Araneus ventricosus]
MCQKIKYVRALAHFPAQTMIDYREEFEGTIKLRSATLKGDSSVLIEVRYRTMKMCQKIKYVRALVHFPAQTMIDYRDEFEGTIKLRSVTLKGREHYRWQKRAFLSIARCEDLNDLLEQRIRSRTLVKSRILT